MELFRCVFIFLGVFLSALKVQSTRNVSIYYHYDKGLCEGDDRYLRIDCKTSINNITQCDARADGSTQEKAESRFQLVRVEIDGTRKIKCIQFTNRSSGEKYALKVVNQSRVVFEKHRCNGNNDPEEFRFKEEKHGRILVYKPFKNQSLCVGKDCVSQKLTLYNNTQNETQDTTRRGHNKKPFNRLCAFQRRRLTENR